MSKLRHEIDKVRMNISSIIYNDCLPTALTTNSLRDICFYYDNYLTASHVTNKTIRSGKQAEALDSIKNSIDMINRQSINSGAGHGILYPKDESLESIRDIGETIAIIYAIPYKAASSIDYVGYAYGETLRKLESPRLYDIYKPDEFMNKCSIAMLERNVDKTAAESIMQEMSKCAGAVDYLKQVENGDINENIQSARNIVKSKFRLLTSEALKLTDADVHVSDDVAEALYTASCINASLTFCNKNNIEQLRDDGVFKDSRAADMTIAHY